uniref:Uncharacterized protein n=1 Tax=viral metagenome TaxID=1070528 RepID=A0A6M3JR95_9ZZZZ
MAKRLSLEERVARHRRRALRGYLWTAARMLWDADGMRGLPRELRGDYTTDPALAMLVAQIAADPTVRRCDVPRKAVAAYSRGDCAASR